MASTAGTESMREHQVDQFDRQHCEQKCRLGATPSAWSIP